MGLVLGGPLPNTTGLLVANEATRFRDPKKRIWDMSLMHGVSNHQLNATRRRCSDSYYSLGPLTDRDVPAINLQSQRLINPGDHCIVPVESDIRRVGSHYKGGYHANRQQMFQRSAFGS